MPASFAFLASFVAPQGLNFKRSGGMGSFQDVPHGNDTGVGDSAHARRRLTGGRRGPSRPGGGHADVRVEPGSAPVPAVPNRPFELPMKFAELTASACSRTAAAAGHLPAIDRLLDPRIGVQLLGPVDGCLLLVA